MTRQLAPGERETVTESIAASMHTALEIAALSLESLPVDALTPAAAAKLVRACKPRLLHEDTATALAEAVKADLCVTSGSRLSG